MNIPITQRITFILAVCIPLLLHCTSIPGIIRETGTTKSETAKTVMPVYSDSSCTVSLKELKLKDWKELLENDCYLNQKRRVRGYRLPSLIFFQLWVKNRSSNPLMVENIHIQYGNSKGNSLTASDIKNKSKSPMYDIFDYESLFSWRKLLVNGHPPAKINYERDTVRLKPPLIPSGNSATRIIAFEWIPVQCKQFSVLVELKTPERKKIIDFKLVKSEYRSKGKFFRKKQRGPNIK